MGKSEPSGSVSRCSIESICNLSKSSSFFRIGKPPVSSTPSVASSSSMFSSAKECWIDASTLGLFHLPGGGRSNHTAATGNGRGVFSNLYQYVSRVGDSGSVPATTTTTTTTSDKFIPSPSSMLLGDSLSHFGMNEIPLVSSFSSYADRMISDYIVAITVGCVLGAAVATGASVGLLAASGILRSSNQYVPVLYGWFARLCGCENGKLATEDERDRGEDSSPYHYDASNNQDADVGYDAQTTTNVTILSPSGGAGVGDSENNKTGSLILLKASASKRCEKCLDDISVLLSKNGATWKTVKQLSVYLVSSPSGTIEPTHFHRALKGYPIETSSCMVSIRFVQRLEDPRAMIEIEALAAVANTA